MRVLGLSGGPHGPGHDPLTFPHLDGYWHDAAAVVVEDGRVVRAHEEERLSRSKHTCAFPYRAVAACVGACVGELGLTAGDLDAVAVYFTEDHWNGFVEDRLLHDPDARLAPPREQIAALLAASGLGGVDPGCIRFVHHHTAHAVAALRHSGFDRALVVTLDGAGDAESGLVATGEMGETSAGGPSDLRVVRSIPIRSSLGGLYLWVTRFLGFSQFDEYKVMGLAALGDPEPLGRELGMVRLAPRGEFEVDWKFALRLRDRGQPRRRDEPVEPFHADLAAAVQAALEDAVLHLLRHARAETGLDRLCLAGGVAHNCAMTGTVAATEQFTEIFVHPASDDAGCAIGAALAAGGRPPAARPGRLTTVSWGTRVTSADLAAAARRWGGWITVEPLPDRVTWAADRLAAGELVPWVVGRAEFGPRALGHRSLLADPRDAGVRDRINRLVKQREPFRPFAPVVRIEDAARWFVVPPGIDCSFMSFAVPLRPGAAEVLPAVTHADGTARLQTVGRDHPSGLWDLLGAVAARTGTPVLLNTSLNVAGEPIVDGIDDLVDLLLSTSLRHAVVDDALVTTCPGRDLDGLAPQLHADVRLVLEPRPPDGSPGWVLARGGPGRWSRPVSPAAAAVLRAAAEHGPVPLAELVGPLGDAVARRACVDEVLSLWRRRVLRLVPEVP